jgi:hypothetical protein
MYTVTGLPRDLSGGSDEQVAELNAEAREKMAHIISPTHRVSLERSGNTFDKDEYALFVTANDVAAARRLHQYTAARAAGRDPLTVETLAGSPEYALLQERSQCARDTLAAQYAAALGIKHEPVAKLTTQHYTIVTANSMAHGNHSSPVQQQAAREARFFVIYNNASPTHDAHDGLIVSQGIMGGHTILATNNGEPWQQPRFLSLMPATTAESHLGHTQLTAEHRGATERSAAAFDARIAWHSELGDNFMHASANESYYAMNDAYSQRWLNSLTPTHHGPLRQRQYNLVAGQLPSVTTLYATPDQLGRIARMPETPENVAVALDNPIVSQIPARWDTRIRPSGYPTDIGSVYANVFESNEDDGFRVLSRASVCLNKGHDHSNEPVGLYADATQFGIASSTGCYRGPNWNASQWVRPDAPDVIDRIGATDTHDFQSHSVIMLDKALLRLLTADINELTKDADRDRDDI